MDGVLTSDSDVLLYGARTVYRNLDTQNKARSTVFIVLIQIHIVKTIEMITEYILGVTLEEEENMAKS